MSQRRRARGQAHEHVITQHLVLTCPRNTAHRLASVSGSSVRIAIAPAPDKGAGSTTNPPDVPLRQDGDRLRTSCPNCARAGLIRRGGDEQVRTDIVLAVIAAMREHGPASLRLPFDAAELKQWLAQRPAVHSHRLPPVTVHAARARRYGAPRDDAGQLNDLVAELRAAVASRWRGDTPG